MSNLPPQGDERPWGENTCARATGPDINRDLCGKPATVHMLWDTMTAAVACDEHAAEARQMFDAHIEDEHVFGGVCNMPNTRWVKASSVDEGRCVWSVDDEALVAEANADIPQPVRA